MLRGAKSKSPALACLAFDLSAGPAGAVQLLPDGEFAAGDGRPGPGKTWKIDAAIAARVIDRFARRKNPAVVDYEHQTLYASFKDGAAPAAGWFGALEYRPGSGLWATPVEWTARATAMITAGEYRYLSAVFSYLPDSGEILEIHHAGLTNNPALDGMASVWGQQAATRFLHPVFDTPEDTVDRAQLIAMLSLAQDATDEAVTAALTALRDTAGRVDALQTQLAAATANAADPAKYVPVAVVEELRGQVSALSAAQVGREVAEIVTAALVDGRLLPAQKTWAESLGRSDLAALRAYVETAQPIPALLRNQTGGKPPAGGTGAHGLTEQQLAICTNCGLDPAEYATSLGIPAAA